MASAQCPKCGFVTSIADELCPRCNTELKKTASSAYHETAYTTDEPQNPTVKIEPHVGVGNVLSAALSLYFKNFWLIAKLVFVIFAPFEIFKALTVSAGEQRWQVVVLAGFLGLVCKALIAPALIYALYRIIQTGMAPGLNESYRWGLSKLGTFCLSVGMAWILQTIGTILCIIPGIIIALGLDPVYPMATLENRGPVEILKRSWKITDGYKGNIFVAMLVMGLLILVAYIPAAIGGAFIATSSHLWPIEALLALIIDLASEATTVLSLVIYLSILASQSRSTRLPQHLPIP
jgi:uncharacterized membrane protein